ncbi:MAG: hypothetical protein K2Y22_15225 [Candidatus Obscuribacterales bacterium]|nr:hypothetical protein [Candidatus Obscuribacterales bacterium]
MEKEKKVIDKQELFALLKTAGVWGSGVLAFYTAVNTFIGANAALEVSPWTIPLPIIQQLEIPFGATDRARKMKVELAQVKKQIAAAKVKEKTEKDCACLTPSEKAQIFVADAEKYLDDSHNAMRSGNFQAVVSAWDNIRRDIRLAQEALQECK